MGLDMYLRGRRYLGFGNEKTAQAVQDCFPELHGMLDSFQYSVVNEVTTEVAYWRKANHIHNWLVKNVQDNVDDCGYYEVSRAQLEQLRDCCVQVLDDFGLADKLLPTQGGFFFGSTEYDEWYKHSLTSTIYQINRALSLPNEWWFEYHSSW
jgi:hypothetical protein